MARASATKDKGRTARLQPGKSAARPESTAARTSVRIKPAAEATAKTEESIERMTAPKDGVTVRMYRQGLGDCFLLAFRKRSGEASYMLIDCGVIVGQVPSDERPTIPEVVQDIAKSTGGRIDVLVATHQHWDHLSGFVQAFEDFQKIEVGQIWLAWTEDPNDKLAAELRAERSRTERALRAAAVRLQGVEGALATSDAAFSDALYGVLGFIGVVKGGALATTEAALKNLLTLSKAKPKYLRPLDDPVALEGLENLRVYPLGPPHDKAKIKRYNDRPTDPQTYHAGEMALDTQASFLGTALGVSNGGKGGLTDAFDQWHRVRKGDARYDELRGRFFHPGDEWRKVDLDWLHASSSLALALDNATNNTSLALAIELQAGGKVLLFAADAQIGNWLSWHDQKWERDGKEVIAEDLLSRAVLYKVGHHASHNATLQQRGLELMTNEELLALVPLDVETARKKHWPMPWPKLKTALMTATKGRMLQVDDTDDVQTRARPAATSNTAWSKFQQCVKTDRLYFEVTIT